MPQADWLITGLEKVILPARTNKTLKETKAYYAV